MAPLTFADTHNMVAFLSKFDASEGFDQIMNFLNAHTIKYALVVNPTIYVSCIKQFWATTTIKKVNDVVQLRALIDGKKVVVSENVIRRDIHLDDADGVECLPNEEIFTELARTGNEKPLPKLTFYKAFFSAQWKFLFHSLVQCPISKRTAWNEFSFSMASAVICLATGRKFNFSKCIFDSMVRNVDNPSKFLMYLCFLQVVMDNQVDDMTSHSTRYASHALTQKVFAHMRIVGKGFLRVETPLFASMLVQPQPQVAKAEEVEMPIASAPPSPINAPSPPPQDPTPTPHATPHASPPHEQPTTTFESSMSLLNTLLETCASLSQKVVELEQDKHTQALEILKLKKRVKKLEKKRRSKHSWRMHPNRGKIEVIDADKDITLMDMEKDEEVVVMDAEPQGRIDQEEVNAATKRVSAAEPTVFDDEEVTMTMAQTLIKLKAKKAKLLDEQIAQKLHDVEVKKAAAKDKQEMMIWKELTGMNYDKVRPIFEREYKKVQTLFKPDKDVEEPKKKRVAEKTLLRESFKKLKAVEVSVSEFKVKALQVKYHIIDWEIHTEGSRTYRKIIRVSGITEAYQSFEDMLKGFDREELVSLWRLVKEKFSSAVPSVDKEKALWVELKRLFEPDVDDVLWKLQSITVAGLRLMLLVKVDTVEFRFYTDFKFSNKVSIIVVLDLSKVANPLYLLRNKDLFKSKDPQRTKEGSHYSSVRTLSARPERLKVLDRLRYNDRHVLDRLGHRRQSAFDRISETYSPSITNSKPGRTSSKERSHGGSRPHRRDVSNGDYPESKECFRGVGESYDNSHSSYGMGISHGYRYHDRDRSRHMKRGRDSESPLSSVSKSDSSDGRHWKSKSKRHKLMDEDDLTMPWMCEEVDPFTPQIWATRVWFDELPPESIDSYKDLKAAFLAYFMQQKKYIKDPIKIHNIKQKDRDTIEDFMEWFKVETGRMKGAPECMRISRFMHGVNNPELTKCLNEHAPKTMEEMMITTTAFIRGEADAASKKKGQPREGRGSSRFTPLTRTPKEILAVEAGKFQPPPPMVTPVEKRSNNKFCDFHNDKGHNTDECMQLKKQIEEPGIKEIQAVPSIAHRMLKFPADGGIVTIRSTILIPAECTTVITSSKEIPKEVGVRHENFEVALHPNFPDQEPSDMTGVPRSVAEHRLNIREGYSPVRQKKRGHAWERAKAIQAEDAYKGYHQIQLAESDEEKMTFHTGQRVYCYTKMPFGLKNAGTTYQRLVDKAFDSQIGRNIEVYVDDLVIKSHTKAEMLRDIVETFRTLRKINMKLNPKKCMFGAVEGIFLGYMITPKGIKLCPDKKEGVLQLPSPRTIKEVQSLNGKLASLNRFLSKSTEKSLPLFKTLKTCIKKSDFHWT
uniref:Reverse transcriptase domain-containing protein n=1 Tax=Tanacetum cinerariifolium TaxID=118510 RepID=A0A6L2JVF6_TANCI|nr:reverse transcriptase domain-containing protein [Tanacetum cinerariifolium]